MEVKVMELKHQNLDTSLFDPVEVTDMAAFTQELAVNRAAYASLKDQLRRDYAGQYVALAFGRLVAVCPDFESATRAVLALQPRPQHFAVFPGDQEPVFEPVYHY
jgi:hypothetical protein